MITTEARVFLLPDLGEGLTEAELVSWLVAVGDEVSIDQPIAEVETAKSSVELPSPFAGVVTALHGAPGELLRVGTPVLEVGGASSPTPAPGAPAASAENGAATGDTESSGRVLIGYGTGEHAGAKRRRAPLNPRSSGRQIPVRREGAPVAVRSPIVRRLARELGVEPSQITPTGDDGAVTRADVLRAAGATPGIPDHLPPGLHVAARERMGMLRRSATETFLRSRREIPEATVWVDVDLTNLWAMRPGMASAGGRAPSLTALLARFVLIALAEHPVLAGRLSADGGELVTFDGVNLGIATDTPRGLLVPVIARAEALPLAALDDALRALAEDARSGSLPPENLSGSTFTLNNYGAFGVDGSAAIINYPEVAILGIGRAIEKPWVVDGELAVRRIAQLSLVFDHRVCDGGYGSSFLHQVVTLLESPLSAYGRV